MKITLRTMTAFLPAGALLLCSSAVLAIDATNFTITCNTFVKGTAKFVSVLVTILDQLGFRDLQVKGPTSLLEPASKMIGIGDPGPVNRAGVDRYECYKVSKPKNSSNFIPVASPLITDEFGVSIAYDLSKPTKLCTPVNKNNEDPGANTHPGHLVCYKAKRHVASVGR